MTSIHIFRRDLRIYDNTSFNLALENSDVVIPLFIVTPQQVSDINKYKSSNAIQFMMESLFDLENQLQKKILRLNYGSIMIQKLIH